MSPVSPTVLHTLYGIEALIALLLFGLMLFFERREFKRRGKGRAWGWLRLLLLPITLLCVAAVVLPARALGGPEALGLFYIGLFTFGPLLWFALHWLAGRRLTPQLTRGEALFLGFTPLAFLWAMVMAGHMMQSVIWEVAISMKQSEYKNALLSPSPYSHSSARRYETADGNFTSISWQTNSPVKVERIDLVREKYTSEDVGHGRSAICQEPGGIRWLRADEDSSARLRVYWRDNEQRLHAVELLPPAMSSAATFAVQWPADPNGFTLPESFPRFSVLIGYTPPEREIQFSNTELESFRPGEDYTMNCFPTGWRSRNRVDGVALLVPRPYPAPPLRIRALRVEPASEQGAENALPAAEFPGHATAKQ